MIRTDREYQESLKRLEEGRRFMKAHRAELEGMGLDPEEVECSLDSVRSFSAQIEEDVEHYERLKRGDIGEVDKLYSVGMKLIALRIALGVTQRELASRMGVHESQSRGTSATIITASPWTGRTGYSRRSACACASSWNRCPRLNLTLRKATGLLKRGRPPRSEWHLG